MIDKIKNIFVSHQHNDADQIKEFSKLIGNHGIKCVIALFMKKN